MKRRSLARSGSWLLLSALTLGATGCDWWHYQAPKLEEVWYAIPWFDHMINSKAVHPYETDTVPRYTPVGTVPVGGVEPDWSAQWIKGDASYANSLVNPYALTSAGARHDAARVQGAELAVVPRNVAAAGDTLYQTFCTVCHGNAGDGHGPVGSLMNAPSLLTARARAYTDGYLYSIIRYGRGVMPRYGDKVYAPDDRWAIVTHIRQLQASTPAVAPVNPAEAHPIPPGPSMTGSTGALP